MPLPALLFLAAGDGARQPQWQPAAATAATYAQVAIVAAVAALAGVSGALWLRSRQWEPDSPPPSPNGRPSSPRAWPGGGNGEEEDHQPSLHSASVLGRCWEWLEAAQSPSASQAPSQVTTQRCASFCLPLASGMSAAWRYGWVLPHPPGPGMRRASCAFLAGVKATGYNMYAIYNIYAAIGAADPLRQDQAC